MSLGYRCHLLTCEKVQYANNHNTEFFLVNRGHALTYSVGEFSGIQIDVRNLRDVTIQPDKKTVRLQAGAYNHEVVSTLWEKGYVASKFWVLSVPSILSFGN